MIEAWANLGGIMSNKLHGVAIDNLRLEPVPDEEHCPTMPEFLMPTEPPAAQQTTGRPLTTATTQPMTTRPGSVSRTTTVRTTTPDPLLSWGCNFDSAVTGEGPCGWSLGTDAFSWKLGRAGSTGNVNGPVNGDNSFPSKGRVVLTLNQRHQHHVPNQPKLEALGSIFSFKPKTCWPLF